jgi:hypothetical protein
VGHEIVVYRDRNLIIHDLDFWALRHFLLAEAEASDDPELAAFIGGWDWIGPGVYLGVEFETFFGGDNGRERAFLKLLHATHGRIESFGESIPLDYLAANGNTQLDYFTTAQPVARLVQQLASLNELFVAAQTP